MSKFPWWDSTLTIYNRYEDAQTQVVTWYATVLTDCFWKATGNEISINNVALDTNTILVRIPENASFMEKYLWNQLPNADKASYFTIGVGDIIVKGGVEDVINEYVDGHRSSDLIEKYKSSPGCMIIDRYGNNTGLGRCKPHYYVTGK